MNKSNVDFLKGVNDFIYAIACAAENNYPDDPNTTNAYTRLTEYDASAGADGGIGIASAELGLWLPSCSLGSACTALYTRHYAERCRIRPDLPDTLAVLSIHLGP